MSCKISYRLNTKPALKKRSKYSLTLKVRKWSFFLISKSCLVLRSVMCQKIAMFEQLNNQILCWLKSKLDPSVERSWCELFKIIKGHGPKNPPKVWSWCPPQVVISKDKIFWSVSSIFNRSLNHFYFQINWSYDLYLGQVLCCSIESINYNDFTNTKWNDDDEVSLYTKLVIYGNGRWRFDCYCHFQAQYIY